MTKLNFGYVSVEEPDCLVGSIIDVTNEFKGEKLTDDLIRHFIYLYGIESIQIAYPNKPVIMDSRNNRLWIHVSLTDNIKKIALEKMMPESEYLEN